jgi:hypothetical protein
MVVAVDHAAKSIKARAISGGNQMLARANYSVSQVAGTFARPSS